MNETHSRQRLTGRDRHGSVQRPSDLRRRMLRHYLPLTVGTLAALAALVSIPFFDVNRYPPPPAIFAESAVGALPDGDTPQPGGPSAGAGAGHQQPDGVQHGGGSAVQEASGATAASMSGDHAGDQDSVLRMRRLSTMTGYVALVLIAVTLLIGPVSLMRGRRLAVSTYLRRDIGIWSAGVSIAHVVFGFLVKHADGQILGYFFESGDRSRVLSNAFGLANWAGLAAVLIVAGLAAISSDSALRRLKAKRWKRLQRWNYVLAVLAVAHSILYGALWRFSSPYTVTLIASVVLVVVGQVIGVRMWRRRRLSPAQS